MIVKHIYSTFSSNHLLFVHMQKSIQSLLRSLEKTSHKYWNITPEVGQFLNLLIKTQNYKTVLEIGTSNGYSGIWLAEALSHTKGHLYTIESHFKKRFHLATQNFKKSNLTKYITQISGHAPEKIPKTPHKFDLAFFDATKYEHIDYWKAVSPRIKKSGLIITDNTISHKKDLQPYIKTAEKDKTFTTIELSLGSGLLLSFKN